jgi:hypothetical protein
MGMRARDRQLQLQGLLELALLTNFDIFSDGLGGTFHGFGGNRQPRQQLHLLPTPIERTFLADRSQHAAHAGREFRVLYIQLYIHWKLTTMAVLAQVVRAETLGLPHSRQHGFRTHLHIAGGVAASTRSLSLFRAGRIELEQLVQHRGSRLVHAGTNRHLHRF